jgi:hypothetical protein
MDAESEPGTEPEGCDREPEENFDLVPSESDADEERFDDDATLDDRNFNIMQSPPPSPAPAASDSEFQGSISAVSDGPSFASGSTTATQPFANLHSEPSTSSPLEYLTPQIEPTLDSDSRARRVRKTRTFDLHACICGVGVTEVEIEAGDSVMKCKVHGCETVWVRHVVELCSSHYSLACLVSSRVHELRFRTEKLDMPEL